MTQTVSKLDQVCLHLMNNMKPFIKNNDLDGWQSGGTLMLCGDDLGTGFLLAKWRYGAVIQIERFPHKRLNPYTLLGLLATWVAEHDPQRHDLALDDPELDIEVVSDDHAQVTIELELVDDIELLPDENGPLVYQGQRYRVALVPVNTAEEAELHTQGPEQ
ncbi:phage tail protein [Pseudoalteromonas obscura]|uniref:Phage tail protein n=1 Tax=Pseudoalteromonas obscura TaxID=3048491 RepID=A0ABT7ES83_9GAMM|nr:phage tail protein [Pseudoalteromonas sp. P94(2023)]MDK2597906.1 phage tail protein [Pseudoalteromonas sp. P94(2023)]